jgi:hypothetical protein
MKRLHLFEIHDQPWCPRVLWDAATDYLQFMVTAARPYASAVPVLAAALQQARARQVLDFCSGAGGPWPWLQRELALHGVTVAVCLSDKFPHAAAVVPAPPGGAASIVYHLSPVDAVRVPDGLMGFRTLFSSFHHFRPDEARAILADAVRRREGIAIFEGTHRTVPGLGACLLVPLVMLLAIPFIRPFRWSRILLTYLIPALPLLGFFDVVVSSLRTYSVRELRELTDAIGANDYQWEIGELKSRAGPIPITYLIGHPRT